MKNRIRCAVCLKKITLTYIECKCGGLFCGNHRYADEHNCTYDHFKNHQDAIRKKHIVIKKNKIEKI